MCFAATQLYGTVVASSLKTVEPWVQEEAIDGEERFQEELQRHFGIGPPG